MSMRSLDASAVLLVLVLGAGRAFAEGPNLGNPVNLTGIAEWDISVHPDGAGLPVGSGTPAEGAKIYVAKCALCPGQDGKGSAEGPTPLICGVPITAISASMKTISNFMPYTNTVFDYIRRALPRH